MIGVINGRIIFEFRDIDEICYALSVFVERYGYESFAILNASNNPIAIAKNGDWVTQPKNLQEDDRYSLYANQNGVYTDINTNSSDEIKFPFYYTLCRIPKELQ